MIWRKPCVEAIPAACPLTSDASRFIRALYNVKKFAQRMLDEHAAANTQRQQLAQQNNRALPIGLAPEHLLAIAELMRLSGQAFDLAYMELNVRMHDKDVQEAERELRESTDAAIRLLAQTAIPVLNDHLARARALRDQVRDSMAATAQ